MAHLWAGSPAPDCACLCSRTIRRPRRSRHSSPLLHNNRQRLKRTKPIPESVVLSGIGVSMTAGKDPKRALYQPAREKSALRESEREAHQRSRSPVNALRDTAPSHHPLSRKATITSYGSVNTEMAHHENGLVYYARRYTVPLAVRSAATAYHPMCFCSNSSNFPSMSANSAMRQTIASVAPEVLRSELLGTKTSLTD